MPSPTPILSLESARRLIRERSFPSRTSVSSTPRRVGVELEWFTTPSDDPPANSSLEAILAPHVLPHCSVVSFEPGAQVELSSAPASGVARACDAIAADAEVVRRVLAAHDIDLFASGFDADRSHRLRTDAPRYVAMREYFDAYGPSAGRMMCASAAVHVNLDAGDDEVGARHWRAAHLVGPTLLAAFANSPLVDGREAWKSARSRAWQMLDPTRTQAVGADGDPLDAWASYALDAHVMFVRDGAGNRYMPLDGSFRFREWIAHGHELGHPDPDDLAYHLTTLFPPVRPHGHLELRMIDMLPDPWWRVAVAVAVALVYDDDARRVVHETCDPSGAMWSLAARCALEDPSLAASAEACFGAALDALPRVGADGTTIAAMHDYIDRYVAHGRCPADDEIDTFIDRPDTIAEAI